MKKYALLYFQQINDKFSKWIFPLHDGENIIGSDKDVDIFLYLNQKQDKIDSVHCKIIVNESLNDVGIISLASNGYVKRGESEEKIILSPGKEYELNHKNVFYLTDNVKFMLIKGTIDEIHEFFVDENLENEFQKWNKFILALESNMKVNLNLTRKESYNKSFISNISNNNDNNNNINLNTSINNNNISLNNSIFHNNNNMNNNNLLNSILNSNNKEVNRIGFNNFDEVPEDNMISDYKVSNHNPINTSAYNRNYINFRNSINNTSPFKIFDNNSNQNDVNNISQRNNVNHFNFKIKQISTDISNNNNIINEKETEINSLKSEIKEEVNLNNNNKSNDNKENNINTNYNKSNNDEYNNSLDLFKQASSEYKLNNNYNEKGVNKDEKTIQTIKELLGENNLEIIFKNTNYNDIKNYDIIFKKSKNNKIINKNAVSFGNFDIQVKKNDFLNKTIKYEHKYKIKSKKQ